MAHWFAITCGTLILTFASGQNATFHDPMIDIKPMLKITSLHSADQPQSESLDNSDPDLQSDDPPQNTGILHPPLRTAEQEASLEYNSAISVYTANKRDVEGNRITIPSEVGLNIEEFDVDLQIQEQEQHQETNTEASTDEQCAYTFILPQPLPQNSHVCVNSEASTTPQSNSADKFFTDLHRDVITAKSQVEDIRNEIIEERQQFPKSAVIDSLRNSVNVLQQESRNMDTRVSQLYMQLLHEIINKRDNTAEIAQLENKLLNQTVKYYNLKEEHDQLKQEHTALRTQLVVQSQQLERLRTQVEGLTTQARSVRNPVLQPRRNVVDPLMTVNRQESISSAIRVRDAMTVTRPQPPTTSRPPRNAGPFRDCTEVQRGGYTDSGVFHLKLQNVTRRIKVWCDFDQDPGGWIVIQRRTGKRVNFYRNMAAYKRGFGRLHGDFWLGLDNIHKLTNQTGINYKLHVDMEDWHGRSTFVEYRSFRVEGEDTKYKLKITHYSGNAGDSLTWHNNMRFTTMDDDNDPFERNCADYQRGGWWYNTCAHSNLNGIYYKGGYYRSQYQDGIYWSEWRGGSYSLKRVSMKIRPTE